MTGYHNLAKETEDTFFTDAQGKRWLRTGDKGELDSEGFLKITDRIKELIKTSGGKYVAPAHIESKLKVAVPISCSVLVHGNNRNFCSALFGFPVEDLELWAKQNGVGGSYADQLNSKALADLLQAALKTVNADLPSYASIKKFAVLPTDLSIEGGELTPSQKVKRKVVEGKYKDLLEGLYTGAKESL
jgi:long-chain acyl-CoA synthetase